MAELEKPPPPPPHKVIIHELVEIRSNIDQLCTSFSSICFPVYSLFTMFFSAKVEANTIRNITFAVTASGLTTPPSSLRIDVGDPVSSVFADNGLIQ